MEKQTGSLEALVMEFLAWPLHCRLLRLVLKNIAKKKIGFWIICWFTVCKRREYSQSILRVCRIPHLKIGILIPQQLYKITTPHYKRRENHFDGSSIPNLTAFLKS